MRRSEMIGSTFPRRLDRPSSAIGASGTRTTFGHADDFLNRRHIDGKDFVAGDEGDELPGVGFRAVQKLLLPDAVPLHL
jgi:hypothetical protein